MCDCQTRKYRCPIYKCGCVSSKYFALVCFLGFIDGKFLDVLIKKRVWMGRYFIATTTYNLKPNT